MKMDEKYDNIEHESWIHYDCLNSCEYDCLFIQQIKYEGKIITGQDIVLKII